jgi:hypothetical protein
MRLAPKSCFIKSGVPSLVEARPTELSLEADNLGEFCVTHGIGDCATLVAHWCEQHACPELDQRQILLGCQQQVETLQEHYAVLHISNDTFFFVDPGRILRYCESGAFSPTRCIATKIKANHPFFMDNRSATRCILDHSANAGKCWVYRAAPDLTRALAANSYGESVMTTFTDWASGIVRQLRTYWVRGMKKWEVRLSASKPNHFVLLFRWKAVGSDASCWTFERKHPFQRTNIDAELRQVLQDPSVLTATNMILHPFVDLMTRLKLPEMDFAAVVTALVAVFESQKA